MRSLSHVSCIFDSWQTKRKNRARARQLSRHNVQSFDIVHTSSVQGSRGFECWSPRVYHRRTTNFDGYKHLFAGFARRMRYSRSIIVIHSQRESRSCHQSTKIRFSPATIWWVENYSLDWPALRWTLHGRRFWSMSKPCLLSTKWWSAKQPSWCCRRLGRLQGNFCYSVSKV